MVVEPVASPVEEGEGAQFTVTRTVTTTGALTVNYDVSETGDMVASDGEGAQSVDFGDGDTEVTVTVPTVEDTDHEADSTVTLALTADAAYHLGTEQSAEVTVEDDDNAAPTGAPTIDDTTPLVGETLTADTSAIGDADGLTGVTYAYRWLRVASDSTETEVGTGESYTVVAADVGATLKVEATFTDEDGTEETVESVVTAAVEAPPKVTLVLTPDTITEGGTSTLTATLDRTSTEDTVVTLQAAGSPLPLPVPLELTIRAGQTESQGDGLMLSPDDDDMDEPDRTLTFSGTAANSEGVTDPDPVTLTIRDNDDTPTVTLRLDPASISENGGVSTVTAGLDHPSSEATTVTVSVTAVAPATSSDYQLSSNVELTIAAGATDSTGAVTITGVDNSAAAPDKEVTVSATATNAHGITDPDAVTLTIRNDDGVPALSIADASVDEGDLGGTTLDFTVTLDRAATATVTANWATSDGTATAGTDYTAATGSLTFDSGDSSKTVSVTVAGDDMDEPNETFTVTLAVQSGATIEDGAATGTITDDDATPTVTLTLDPDSISETGGASTVTAGLDHPSSQPTTVTVTLTPVPPAVAGDYTLSTNRELTIAAGETGSTGVVTINPVNDQLDQPNKRVTVSATATNTLGIRAPQDVTLTISDDENVAPTGAPIINDTTPESGDTLTADTSGIVDSDGLTAATFRYLWFRVRGGETQVGTGESYTVLDADVGRRLKVVVKYIDDGGTTETVESALTGTVTEPSVLPQLTLHLDPASITEAGGTSTVTASLDRGVGREIVLRVEANAVSPATASDFTLSSNRTLRFPPGRTESTRRVTITAVDDAKDAPDKRVTVSAGHSGPSTGVSGPEPVTLTIEDDDDPPTGLSIRDASVDEGDSGDATMTFTVTLSPAATGTVTVDWATADGTATAGADYTAGSGSLTFDDGDASKEVSVLVTGENVDESNETFTVTLSSAVGATIGDAEATGTIRDDDDAPTVTLHLDPASISENGGVSTVTASLDHPSSQGTTVWLSVTPAAAGDYLIPNTILVIQPSETESTGLVTITAVDNAVDAPNKTVTVSSNLVVNTLGANDPEPVMLTIRDDENVAPTGAPTIDDTTPMVGETLTADASGIADPDGLTGATFTYQWIRVSGGTETPITGATTATYTVVAADLGATLKVKATFTDDGGAIETLESAETGTVAAAPLPPPPPPGGRVFVSNTSGDVLGSEHVLPARAQPFTTGNVSGGYNLSSVVLAIDSPGSDVRVTIRESEADGSPGGVVHELTNPPSDAGGGLHEYSAPAGATLEADTVYHVMAERTSVTARTWKVTDSGREDPGAAPGWEIGGSFWILEHGTWTSFRSSLQIQVKGTGGNTDPTGAPTIDDTTPVVGETLTADASGIADADGLTGAAFTWQWIRMSGGTETRIAGATTASYTVVAADVGATLKVAAGFTDDGGTAEMVESAETAAVAVFPEVTVASDGDVTEGSAAVFTLTRTGDKAQALDVAYEVTVSGNFGVTTGAGTATFPAKDATVQVSLATTGDSTHEAHGSVTVTLQADAAYDLGADAAVTATIRDDDDSPATGAVAITGTPTEGETLTADRSGLADADGLDNAAWVYQWVRTPSGGSDADISGATSQTYVPIFADMGATLKVRVTVTDDEGHQATFTSAPTAVVAALPRPEVTPSSDGDVTEGSPAVFTLTRTGSTAGTLRVVFDIEPLGGDFGIAAEDGTTFPVGRRTEAETTFPAGSSTTQVSLSTVDDNTHEADGTVFLSMLVSDDYVLGDPDYAMLKIRDNDNAAPTGAPTIDDTTPVVGETLTADASGIDDPDGLTSPSFTWQWIRTSGGTATPISGATTASYTVVAADVGATLKVQAIFTDDDGIQETVESAETATVEAVRALSIADASVDEGDSGSTTLDFTVTLDPAATETVTVDWATSDGTATAGTDYTAGTGSLTFNAGDSSRTVSVTVAGDNVDEPNETFTVTLSGESGATIEDGAATGTITDDDATPTVTLTLAPDSISEAGGVATVTATLDHPSSESTTVTVTATPESPAVAGDYTLSGSQLTIAAGGTASTGAVTIIAVDNAVDAPHKTVSVSATATNAQGITQPQDVTLTVTDDENVAPTGAPTIDDTMPVVGATLTVDTSGIGDSDGLAGVAYAYRWIRVAAGGAEAEVGTGAMYTVVAGDLGSTLKVEASFTDDGGTAEKVESAATAAVVAAPRSRVSVERVASPVQEGEDAEFRVTRTAVTAGALTVHYRVSESGAMVASGEEGAKTIDFVDGVTEQTVTVPTVEDTGHEADSTVTLTLTPNAAYDLGTAAADVTVEDDDNADPTGAPTIDDTTPVVGETLTADTSGIGDADGLTGVAYAYRWLRVASDSTETEVGTGESYTVVAADVGATLKVEVSYTDDDGTGETLESVVTATAELPPPKVTLVLTPDTITEGGTSTLTATLDRASSADTVVTYTVTLAGSSQPSPLPLTIRAGQTESHGDGIMFPFEDNDVDEPDRALTLSGTAANSEGVTDPDPVTLTIRDNDDTPTVTLRLDPASISENGGVSTVTASLDHPSSDTTTVTVSVTATSGDYALSSNVELTIAAGATDSMGAVTITGVDNSAEAPDKEATVSATAANSHGITDPDAVTLTIRNDDGAVTPVLSIADASVDEGDSGSTTLDFTVMLDRAATGTVTVDWATSDGAATAGTDYTAATGSLTFNSGDSSKTISVTVAGDNIDEPNETFTVTLSGESGAAIEDGAATGTITDDDATPTVTLTLTPDSISEAGGMATVTAGLDHPSSQATTVTLTLTPVPPATPGDYVATLDLRLTIPAGPTESTGEGVTIDARNNAVDAPHKRVTVSATATNALGITAPQNVTLTIRDDENVAPTGAPTIDDTTPVVGETLTVDPSGIGDSDGLAGVAYAYRWIRVAAGGAETQVGTGQSYTVVAADVGATLKVEASFTDEGGAEETVESVVTSTVVAAVPPPPLPELSIGDASVDEGDSGGTTLDFTVTLDSAATGTVTVDWATSDGAATAGTDYTAGNGTLTFNAGDSSKTVSVTVAGDDVDEPNETFEVTLTNPSGATLGDDTGTGTITDDDDTPTVTLRLKPDSISEKGDKPSAVTASLDRPSSQETTLVVTVTPEPPAVASDYTLSASRLTIPAGATTSRKSLQIAPRDNNVYEGDKTLEVSALASNSQGITGPEAVTLTITDDEVPSASLSIGDASVDEGDSGSATLDFTVTLDPVATETVTVNWATIARTATAGTDYTGGSGTLTFNVGDTSRAVSVTVLGDDVDEPDETFTVLLSNASGARIGDEGATGTITDDDDPPTATLVLTPDTIAENGGVSTVTATLDHPSSQDTTLTVTAAPESPAVAGDYGLSGSELTIPAGDTASTGTVTITAVDNAVDAPNKRLTVSAAATNAQGITPPQDVTLTVADDENVAPTGVPTIDDTTPVVGETLTADMSGIGDSDGLAGVAYAYEWFRVASDGTETPIAGATEATYRVAAADIGATLKVRVTFTDNGGAEEMVESAVTAAAEAALIFLRAEVNGNLLTVTMNQTLDDASVPAASAFTVSLGGGRGAHGGGERVGRDVNGDAGGGRGRDGDGELRGAGQRTGASGRGGERGGSVHGRTGGERDADGDAGADAGHDWRERWREHGDGHDGQALVAGGDGGVGGDAGVPGRGGRLHAEREPVDDCDQLPDEHGYGDDHGERQRRGRARQDGDSVGRVDEHPGR